MKRINYFFLLLGTLLLSCQTAEEHAAQDTPTSGVLKIYADKGLEKLIENQTYTFSQLYKQAKFDVYYHSEQEAIKALYDDSCKVIALNRNFSTTELEQFKQANVYLNTSFICKSAIVLLVNKEATDSTIKLEALKALIGGDSSSSYFNKIVFENEKSSAIYYCTDSLLKKKSIGKNCYAVKDFTELFTLLNTNKRSIAVLDYAWISDSDDSLTKSIKEKYKLLAVAPVGKDVAYYPDQSNIQTTDYPLTRYVYVTRRGQDFSLAAGFITFVAGPNGQVMLLKTGFAPWRQPERVISIDMKPIN